MAEFGCFSVTSMEAATATSHLLLGLSSSPTLFSPLPRKSVRVSNLRRRNRFFRTLLSKQDPDLDIVSSNEQPDGSIVFHFGHVRETVKESVETEKSNVSPSVSDEVASAEAVLTEEVLGKDNQDQIVHGEHDYATTELVHDNGDKSKELSHDKALDVESDTIGSAFASVASADSKATVDPNSYGSPLIDTINQRNSISESQFYASAAVSDIGSPLLDEKVNEGKDIINKFQVDALVIVSSSNGAPLDITTSEGNNMIGESQIDTVKEEDSGINEAEFDTSTAVSKSDGSQLDATLKEQNSVINEAEVNTSSLDDLDLDKSIKKETHMISGAQFDTSNIVSSSDGSQLDDNATDESSTIKEVKFDTSTSGSSSDGSQLRETANEENGIIGEAQIHASIVDSSSDGSQLDLTKNKESSIIGETQPGTSTTALNVDGPQLGQTANEGGGSVRETEFVTSTTASNADVSQLDDRVNQESTVISSTNQSQPSSILTKSDVTSESFTEKKSEIKTLVEEIGSVSLEHAVSSHPIDKSKEEDIQIDVTDYPTGAKDSKHDPESLADEDSKVLLTSTSFEATHVLMENASHDTTTTQEDLPGRSLEEAGVKHEVRSGDSAIMIQVSMEESGYAETDTNREEISITELCVASGAASLPHPSKALTGGEDAYFIGQKWLGVADGASQWSLEGVNTGLYARELMENSKEIMSTSKSITDPTALIVKSAGRTQTPGMSTVLVAYFSGQALHVANIGDTGFMIIRNGTILKRSVPLVHEFNFPMQIETGNDPLKIVEHYKTELDEGDIIVFATDGLFDNLYEQEIVSIIQKALREGLKPQDTAKILATRAHEVGSSAFARSPFADAAHAAGYVGYAGGKLDDVTVIVSMLERNPSSHPGA